MGTRENIKEIRNGLNELYGKINGVSNELVKDCIRRKGKITDKNISDKITNEEIDTILGALDNIEKALENYKKR